MKTLKSLCLLSFIALTMFAGSVYSIELMQKTATPTLTMQVQPTPRFATVTPAMLTKILAIPNRATMVNSLLANPAAKTVLTSAATKAGISVAQLPDRSLDGRTVTTIPQELTLRFGCSNIDWRAGVKITPFVAPPVCANGRALAHLAAQNIFLRDYLSPPNAMYVYTNRFDEHKEGIVQIAIDLPHENALYAVKIHLLNYQWIMSTGNLQFYVTDMPPYVESWRPSWDFSNPIALSPTNLPDGTGVSFLINTYQSYWTDNPYKLKGIRIVLGYNSIEYADILFGGITITRL